MVFEGFEIGQVMLLDANFVDENDAPINPATVSVKVTEPDGNAVLPTVTNTGAIGSYRASFPITKAGLHHYRWSSTGAQTAETTFFRVDAPPVPI